MPPSATNEEIYNKVWDHVYFDRHIQVEEIAKALVILQVSTILHDHLGMHKLTAHWVPKSFSDKQMTVSSSGQMDKLF